ncbi:MAG: glycosyltransferase family 2 protein [Bryobacteraceae bacterium]|nr:glycosyltransferase family 2 protein [Bryobacteraceae bacterium]
MKLSLVICTHNPRRDYLNQTMAGLRRQSLPLLEWELILIDNCSEKPLAGQIDLSWHPHGRVVSEEELGLTAARQRGADEAVSELLLYVDDDNVLASDYLAQVLRLGREWPMLGAWGAGELEGIFEIEPPEWTRAYYEHLTVHKVTDDRWTNQPDLNCFAPGAGLAVRRTAVRSYFNELGTNGIRRAFDRRGQSLSSSGDMDMLWTVTRQGWGVGRFTCLKLQHLIPARRLEESYLEKMVASQWCSNILLRYVHGAHQPDRPENWLRRLSRWRYERTLLGRDRWFYDARRKGSEQAERIIAKLEQENGSIQYDQAAALLAWADEPKKGW